MDWEDPRSLRVFVAGEARERAPLSRALTALGHQMIDDQASLGDVGLIAAAGGTDLAIVIVGESPERALAVIGRIVRDAACPVIAILSAQDRTFVNEAAKRGIFAYLGGGEDLEALQSSIDVALARFAEYHDLEGALARRAITERAKGVLMERHSVGEDEAFAMLRVHARRSNRKVVDVAEAVLTSHLLLPVDSGDPGEPSSLADDDGDPVARV